MIGGIVQIERQVLGYHVPSALKNTTTKETFFNTTGHIQGRDPTGAPIAPIVVINQAI